MNIKIFTDRQTYNYNVACSLPASLWKSVFLSRPIIQTLEIYQTDQEESGRADALFVHWKLSLKGAMRRTIIAGRIGK